MSEVRITLTITSDAPLNPDHVPTLAAAARDGFKVDGWDVVSVETEFADEEIRVGDEVTVLGDSAGWGHRFKAGVVGKVIDIFDNSRNAHGDYAGPYILGYTVQSGDVEEFAQVWDVAPVDLERV